MSHRPARTGEATIGWKLQREIILILAWGPAILLQLAHALVARGIADHSAFLFERRGRRSWGPRHEAALRLSARLIRNVLPLTPSVLRHWPAARRAAS